MASICCSPPERSPTRSFSRRCRAGKSSRPGRGRPPWRRQLQVLNRGELGEQGSEVGDEHQAGPVHAARRRPLTGCPFEVDGARPRRQEAGQGHEQRRLAGAVGPEDGEHLRGSARRRCRGQRSACRSRRRGPGTRGRAAPRLGTAVLRPVLEHRRSLTSPPAVGGSLRDTPSTPPRCGGSPPASRWRSARRSRGRRSCRTGSGPGSCRGPPAGWSPRCRVRPAAARPATGSRCCRGRPPARRAAGGAVPGQGAGHRDELALTLGEHRHLQVAHVGQPEVLEDPVQTPRGRSRGPVLAHLHVLLHGQVVGHAGQLEGAGQSEGGPAVRRAPSTSSPARNTCPRTRGTRTARRWSWSCRRRWGRSTRRSGPGPPRS